MKILATLLTGFIITVNAFAVTPAQDIAATINLNGFACGNEVTDIKEIEDGNGNKTISARCTDGKDYQIYISSKGRVTVKPL